MENQLVHGENLGLEHEVNHPRDLVKMHQPDRGNLIIQSELYEVLLGQIKRILLLPGKTDRVKLPLAMINLLRKKQRHGSGRVDPDNSSNFQILIFFYDISGVLETFLTRELLGFPHI